MLLCCKYTKSSLYIQTKAQKTIVVWPINANYSILKNLRLYTPRLFFCVSMPSCRNISLFIKK